MQHQNLKQALKPKEAVRLEPRHRLTLLVTTKTHRQQVNPIKMYRVIRIRNYKRLLVRTILTFNLQNGSCLEMAEVDYKVAATSWGILI